MKNRIWLVVIISLLVLFSSYAIDWWPPGDISGDDYFHIKNFVTICDTNGSCLHNVSATGAASWNISGSIWLINDSNILDWNETKANNTYVNLAGDTMTGNLIVPNLGIGTGSPAGLQINSTTTETSRGSINIRLGVFGTPRIIWDLGNTSTQWEIDNSGGDMRFFQPGTVHMRLSDTLLTVYNDLLIGDELNVSDVSNFDGDLLPITSVTHDIGSGPRRWKDLYVSDISADSIDATGNIESLQNVTALNFIGNGAELTDLVVTNGSVIFINSSPVMDENLTIQGRGYSVIISGTTIYSDTYYNPLLILGGGTSATGNNAIAAGASATANGNFAVALGSLATANSADAIALGTTSNAGYRAIGLGYASSASGSYSTALGYATTASGSYSTAIGQQVKSSGLYSLGMVSSSNAEGDYSVSIGKTTNASGDNSYAFGDNVTVVGEHSFGFGEDGTSTEDNKMTLHNLNLVVDGNATANNFIGDLIGNADAWITMTSLQSKWLADVGNVLTFDEEELNSSIETALTTTFYNASSLVAVVGTTQGAITNIRSYNNVPFNISEVSSDFDLRINFTNVSNINQLVFRFKSVFDAHQFHTQIWDYTDNVWEDYGTEGGRLSYGVFVYSIFDSTDHISDETVQVRFYVDGGAPPKTHKWMFDWVTVSEGPPTPSSYESDPWSVHLDGNTPLTGNWDAGDFNITADTVNVDYLSVVNAPAESPSGTWLTYWNGTNSLSSAPTAADVDPGTFPTGDYVFDGWVNGTSFNGTYYGDGSFLSGIVSGLWSNVSGVATYDGNANLTGNLTLGGGTFFTNDSSVYYNNGTDEWNLLDRGIPTGMIAPFNLSSCPNGWNLADGTSGTPDLRGIFVRGSGTSGELDYANGTDVSATFGEYWNDEFQDHEHNFARQTDTSYGGLGVAHIGTTNNVANYVVNKDTDSPKIAGATTGTPRVGAETRPFSYNTIYCVKASASTVEDDALFSESNGVVQFANESDSFGDSNVFIKARAYRAAAQNINGWARVDIDATTFDPNSIVDTTNHRITPGKTGYYQINAVINIQDLRSGEFINIAIWKNGAAVTSGPWDSTTITHTKGTSIADIMYLDDDDYIELYAYASNNRGLALSGSLYPFISILGPY